MAAKSMGERGRKVRAQPVGSPQPAGRDSEKVARGSTSGSRARLYRLQHRPACGTAHNIGHMLYSTQHSLFKKSFLLNGSVKMI